MLHTTGALEVKVLTFNFVEGGTLVWYQLSNPINQVETGSIPKINTKYSINSTDLTWVYSVLKWGNLILAVLAIFFKRKAHITHIHTILGFRFLVTGTLFKNITEETAYLWKNLHRPIILCMHLVITNKKNLSGTFDCVLDIAKT